MDEKHCGEKTVRNVGCSVKECMYHTPSDVCCAHEIKVSNEQAKTKAETFCSTFIGKAEF